MQAPSGAICGIKFWNRRVIYLLMDAYKELRSPCTDIPKLNQREYSHNFYLKMCTKNYRANIQREWELSADLLIHGDTTFAVYSLTSAYYTEMMSSGNLGKILSRLQSWTRLAY